MTLINKWCVKIEDEAMSERIQRRLFASGVFWVGNDSDVVGNTNKPYLVVREHDDGSYLFYSREIMESYRMAGEFELCRHFGFVDSHFADGMFSI